MQQRDSGERQVNIDDIWETVVSRLAAEMNEAARNTYLRSLSPISLDGSVFTIATSTEFARGYLQDKYAAAFSRALSDALRHTITARFVVVASRSSEAPGPEDRVAPAIQTSPLPSPPSPRGFVTTDLNAKYVFENFVVGRSNQLAHAAALNVARAPGSTYNPLFLYGGVGLGKTHLMQAIGHYASEEHPEMRVVYISGETFLNHVVTAIRENRTDAFRRSYRSVDLWLVDDIQFIASKEQSRTEAEFFHTFNALYETNKQIVITSDRPPRELQFMDDRLRSRFEMGLLTDMRMPDEETRVAILQKKAQLEHVDIPNEVLRYIAQLIQSSVRALEGALTRVIATSSLTGSPVTLENAQEWLADFTAHSGFKRISATQIRDIVARHFGLKPAELAGPKRDRAVVLPRQVAMYLARSLTDASTVKIGAAFGGRDHSTVLHACSKIDELVHTDPEIAHMVEDLTLQLQSVEA